MAKHFIGQFLQINDKFNQKRSNDIDKIFMIKIKFTSTLISLDTGHTLNVHKTFRRCLGRLPNINLCTLNLCPVSRGRNVKFVKFARIPDQKILKIVRFLVLCRCNIWLKKVIQKSIKNKISKQIIRNLTIPYIWDKVFNNGPSKIF